MQVGPLFANFSNLRVHARRAPTVVAPSAPPTQSSGDVRRALSRVRALRETLTDLQTQVSTAGGAIGVSESRSSFAGTAATTSTIVSTEEVNATTSSFSPHGPDWRDDSTALPHVTGIYNGATNATI